MSKHAAICLCLALAAAPAGLAEEPATDANIVTGIDISDSVPAAETRRQIAALAAAARSPELAAAIRRGRAGRIGFALFAWHHHQVEVVPWTVIATDEDAEAVARAIERRIPVNASEEARRLGDEYIGRLTDLSRAIDHASALLEIAPFAAGRGVFNIVGNGPDNMGEPAAPARDRLLAAGASINGVVPAADPAVLDYYRAEVAGGTGTFVLTTEDGDLAELMRRKFVMDLVAAAPPATGAR
jgi:hypothetical protein